MDSIPPRVVIDGVLYVPAKSLAGSVSIEAIGQALLTTFWGEVEKGEVTEKMQGLSIQVTEESGETGLSWEDFLRVLAEKNG